MSTGYNEDQLVAALLACLPSAGQRGKGVRVKPGLDDCAVVSPPKRTRWQLLKTDCVIEGVHFLPDTTPEDVGWKALCRPLSDIAATGGKPLHALVTFAINPGRTLDWATGVYRGIAQAAREFGVEIVGGETSSTPGPSLLSVCVTGSVRPGRCITRGGGWAGDVLCVTGRLGGSFPSGKHLRFRPRLEEGRWLARQEGVHAMMDLSDGLAADLPRLAEASGTGFCLEPSQVPRTEGCSLAQALGDGEDYELLVSIVPEKLEAIRAAWESSFPYLPLTPMGKLSTPDVREGLGAANGFDHFAT